ncbi:MAG: hypothetical protein IK078_10830 [Lachnospiraceae bacterium]|nr:hypothetical protein [Lachnospiraceae bacterium]
MFGFGKKEKNVLLSDRQIREITKNMSAKEARKFIKEQRRLREEVEDNAMMLYEVFQDD